QNPFAQNAASGTVYDVSDVSFAIGNGGNETAALATLLNITQDLNRLKTRDLFQIFVSPGSPTNGFQGWMSLVTSPLLQVSTIVTPFSQNPFSQNPFSQNPFTQNPFSQNPFSQNPFSQNPFTQNPFTQNPFTQNIDPRDPSVSNSSYSVSPL